MNATLQDLLHAINLLGNDTDVCVDGFGVIAVCPPVKLTPAGCERFKQALTANVFVEYIDDNHRNTYVSDDDEAINGMSWTFLSSLAGYCQYDDYGRWFEGKESELI